MSNINNAAANVVEENEEKTNMDVVREIIEEERIEKPERPKKDYNLNAVHIEADSFEPENHYYTKVLNANLHPMVKSFLSMSAVRIASRFCHLNPAVDEMKLLELLRGQPQYFTWGGADLFNVTSHEGKRQMIIIETNSCPSGQKSMPFDSDEVAHSGYHKLMNETFMRLVRVREADKSLPEGCLAFGGLCSYELLSRCCSLARTQTLIITCTPSLQFSTKTTWRQAATRRRWQT
jgi:hypothetical protein